MDECVSMFLVRKLIRKQIALMTGYFGRDDPKGVVGQSLIVPGVHARLSNISATRHFVEDEQFEIGGNQLSPSGRRAAVPKASHSCFV